MTASKEGSMEWKIKRMWNALFGNGREGLISQMASLKTLMRIVILMLLLVLSGIIGMSYKTFMTMP